MSFKTNQLLMLIHAVNNQSTPPSLYVCNTNLLLSQPSLLLYLFVTVGGLANHYYHIIITPCLLKETSWSLIVEIISQIINYFLPVARSPLIEVNASTFA